MQGSSGFIGTSVSRRLVGHSTAVVHLRHRSVIQPRVSRTHSGLIVDLDLLSDAHNRWLANASGIPGPDGLLLLGWGDVRSPQLTSHIDTSPRLVLTLAKTAIGRGCQRILFAGSIDEYGNQPGQLHEARVLPKPINAYVAGKLIARDGLEMICAQRDSNFVHCRIGNVYGPTPAAESLTRSLWDASARRLPITLGACDTWRDHSYVEDIARALSSVLNSDIVGTINVGNGEPTQVKELAESLWLAFGGNRESLVFAPAEAQPVESRSDLWYLDTSLIWALTDWRPSFTLDEGARDTARLLRLETSQT